MMEPERRRTWLIVGIVLAVVILVGGVCVLLPAITSG